MAKPKKQRLAPTYEPHDAAILAVDPGETSGWAIYNRGVLQESGECDVFSDAPSRVIEYLKTFAALHLIVVERPFMVRFGTQVAVGAGDVIWRRCAERNGLRSRIVRVYPATWRARITGMSSAKREVARAAEQVRAVQETGASCGPDEAAAVCIGLWAIRAGEVAAKLPKKRAKKASAA